MTGCGHPVCRQLHAIERANLRRRDVGQRLADRQTGGSGKVQQRHRRAFANRHGFAVIAVKAGGSHRAVSHRDLPRPHHLIARHHTGDGAVADGDEEGFLRHGRQVQHAIHRVGNSDFLTYQTLALGFQRLHVAGHFRRFAQQHVKRQVDRAIVKMAIVEAQMQRFGGFANHRVRRAFAAAQLIKQRQLLRRDRQHITFLRFVTPDLQRAHARLIAEDIAQLEFTAASAVADQFRHRVRQTAGADVVDKQNRVGVAQLPTAVDNFLAATFHLRVIALYGGKIQIGIRLAGGH